MSGRRGHLRWLEVSKLRFAPVMKWFVLEAQDGRKVRVSAMLLGLPEFAQAVLAHVPVEAIEPGTLQILQETSRGQPPSVWG